MGRLLDLVRRVGADPADSTAQRDRKVLLVTFALLVMPAGLSWGGDG